MGVRVRIKPNKQHCNCRFCDKTMKEGIDLGKVLIKAWRSNKIPHHAYVCQTCADALHKGLNLVIPMTIKDLDALHKYHVINKGKTQ